MSKRKLSSEQYEKYIQNPLSYDKELRKIFDIPDDYYYSVATMNEVGLVTVFSKIKNKKND